MLVEQSPPDKGALPWTSDGQSLTAVISGVAGLKEACFGSCFAMLCCESQFPFIFYSMKQI